MASKIQILGNELSGEPTVLPREQVIDDDEFTTLITTWSIRGISIETRARVKAMARNRRITIPRLIDEMVLKEWKEQKYQKIRPGLSRKLRSDLEKVLLLTSSRTVSATKRKRSRPRNRGRNT